MNLNINSTDLSYLYGSFLGDGCAYIGKNSYQFSITSEDKNLCEIINEICYDLLNKKGRIKAVFRDDGTVSYHQLVLCSKEFVYFLIDITSNKTKIPEFAISNDENKLSFIQGLMDTDGWISKVNASDGHLRYRVGFRNTAVWSVDLKNMLNDFNVKTGETRKTKTYRYNIRNKDSYCLSINSFDYCSKIGFRISRKRKLAEECLLFYQSHRRQLNGRTQNP